MISIQIDDNCTVFKVVGEVTVNEILIQLGEYMSGKPTKKVIWDFTETKKIKITTLEVKSVADKLKELSKDKEARRVALVGSKTINIGLGKVFVAFAEMAELPNTYKVFRSMHLAKEWLEDNTDDLHLSSTG